MSTTHLYEAALDDIEDAEHYAEKINNEIKNLKYFRYSCKNCTQQFMYRKELYDHELKEHSIKTPYILFNNKVPPSNFFINDLEKLKNINFINCNEIQIEGFNINERIIAENFKSSSLLIDNGDFILTLITQGVHYTKYYLKINNVPDKLIASANKEFISFFSKEFFTWEEIRKFESNYKSSLVKNYVAALCDYVRGIKYRNNEINNKSIERAKWKEVFNRSFSELQYHQNVLSDSIVNIIKICIHDFENFNPTQTFYVDGLTVLLSELKLSGKSKIRSLPDFKNNIPLIPIDDSIENLLEFYQNILVKKYVQKLTFNETTLNNEIFLMKILFLWQNTAVNKDYKDLNYLRKIILTIENNRDFKLFFEEIRKTDGK